MDLRNQTSSREGAEKQTDQLPADRWECVHLEMAGGISKIESGTMYPMTGVALNIADDCSTASIHRWADAHGRAWVGAFRGHRSSRMALRPCEIDKVRKRCACHMAWIGLKEKVPEDVAGARADAVQT